MACCANCNSGLPCYPSPMGYGSHNAWNARQRSRGYSTFGRLGQVGAQGQPATGSQNIDDEDPEDIDLIITDEFGGGLDEGDLLEDFFPGAGTPGAVPVRVDNWDLEAQPFATYTIASGDTFVGLAKTYLGNGERWKEIYGTGGNAAKFPDPDVIKSVGPLDMPDEARDNLVAFLELDEPAGKTPGTLTTKEKKDVAKEIEDAKKRPGRIVAAALGVAALGVLGVVVYKVSS